MPVGASNSLWASHGSRFTDENSLVKRIFVWRLDGGILTRLNIAIEQQVENSILTDDVLAGISITDALSEM